MSGSNAVEEFCADAFEIDTSTLLRDPQASCDVHGPERDDAVRHACGDDLCGQILVFVLCFD